MRLIDRDEILNRIGAIVSKFPEEYDEKTYKMIRCEIRNKNREVKAIPIEWLYQKRTLYLENECYMSLMVINEILNWWEAERGTNQ